MSKSTNQDNVPKVTVPVLGKKRVAVELVDNVREPPTWAQATGYRLASRVL